MHSKPRAIHSWRPTRYRIWHRPRPRRSCATSRAITCCARPPTRCTGAIYSHDLKPVLEVDSGDTVTIEALTPTRRDDWDRMIAGDPGARERLSLDRRPARNVNRRGAGPMDASIYGRGAGEGFGVHILTGPIAVRGAEPGDVLEVRIIDIHARRCANPDFLGRRLRQQCGGMVGLSLSGVAGRTEAARGRHYL